MNMNEIRKKAQDVGINSNKMKKMEAIKAIQRAENNIECYGTRSTEDCPENQCLWKSDCQTANKKMNMI